MGSIDPIANVVLEALINSLWQGMLLFVAVICILRKLRKLNATTRYVILWLTLLTLAFLPFLRLVLVAAQPVNLMSEYSGRGTVDGEDAVESGTGERGQVLPGQRAALLPSKDGRTTASHAAKGFIARLRNFGPITIPVPFRVLPSIILGLWILMSVFMLSRLLRSYFHISRLKRDISALSPACQQNITEFIRSTGLRRKVAIYVANGAEMPMAIGLVRPAILIPNDLMGKLNEEDLKHLVLHESAHIKRWDDWTYMIQRVIEALYFWNPMVLYIGRQLNLEREIACDDWVIVSSGRPKSYALCLTKLIEHGMPKSDRIVATGTALHRGHISTRIRMLLDKGSNVNAQLSRFGVLATICVIVMAFAAFARISNFLALAEPHIDESPRWTAKHSVPRPVAIQYPKRNLSENICRRVKYDGKEDRIPFGIEGGRIASGSSIKLKDDEISVLELTALQDARLNLSENTYERSKNNREEWRIADVLSETLLDKPVKTYHGVIDEVGKRGQPDIAELIKTMGNSSEEDHFEDTETACGTGDPHIPVMGKVRTESLLEGVKASSRKMLENLGDGQEKLHRKAADTLAGMEEPIIEAKGNVQNLVDKIFSAIEK